MAPGTVRRAVYWDSCAFLGLLKPEEDKQAACERTIQAAERGEILIVTSALTLTEVVHLKGRDRLTSALEKKIADYFKNEYLDIWAAGRQICENARTLLWRHSALRPKDAIHVATALEAKVHELNTFDEYLLGMNEAEGSPLRTLVVRKPGVGMEADLPLGLPEETDAD